MGETCRTTFHESEAPGSRSGRAGASSGTEDRGARRRASVPCDPVELYLADLRRRPLLAKEEVSALARAVRAGQAAAAMEPPPCPLERARRRRAVVEGRIAAEALVEANLRLVVYLARRYRHATDLGVLDLVQEGNLGLMRAVERFDPDRGYAFSTYAVWWARAGMAAAVAKSSGRVRRRPGGHADVSRSGGRVRLVSLSSVDGRSGRHLDEVLEDSGSPSPADQVAAGSLRAAVASLLRVLDDRERLVLSLHFGLDGHRARPLREIAGTLGVSEERVRQIEVAALEKLRRPGRRRESALELLGG